MSAVPERLICLNRLESYAQVGVTFRERSPSRIASSSDGVEGDDD